MCSLLSLTMPSCAETDKDVYLELRKAHRTLVGNTIKFGKIFKHFTKEGMSNHL